MSNIWAIQAYPEKSQEQFNNLQKGIANFGWSYKEGCDLETIKTLNYNERIKWGNCWTKGKWILDIKSEDWVAYINVPSYGNVTIAKVENGYYYENNTDNLLGSDGRHCVKVDPTTIQTFKRNASFVSAPLSKNLKNRGAYWRVKNRDDFFKLVEELKNPNQIERQKSEELGNNKKSFYERSLKELQNCYPDKHLEKLLETTFSNISNVTGVKNNGSGWGTDFSADLIVTYLDGIPTLNMGEEKTLVVQVASFKGNFNSEFKVEQVKTAIEKFEADMGLIATTSSSVSEEIEIKIAELSKELNVPIRILYGTEFMEFVLANTFLTNDNTTS